MMMFRLRLYISIVATAKGVLRFQRLSISGFLTSQLMVTVSTP